MRNFKVVDSDMDYKTYQRTFSGRLTKLRYKIIQRWVRVKSYRTYCGHEWDCCGCLHSQNAHFKYERNQVTVTLTQSFNY